MLLRLVSRQLQSNTTPLFAKQAQDLDAFSTERNYPACREGVMSALLDALKVRLPIFLSPMAGVSTPALAAAVTDAGGLGSIAVGSVNAAKARHMIQEVQLPTPVRAAVAQHSGLGHRSLPCTLATFL